MIDFSDPSSYRGINSDDLAIYVKLEQAHLNREIENVLGEGGTFSTHSTDEFARLQEDFNSAYESYVKGMALLSMGWYRTPMVPGGPDPMTFTKVVGSIALSCTLGPWAAFALNAALTGVDVAVGTTAWKHAAVQLGVGAAAAYAPGIGSQLVNIAASGIDYEEGGGIGWDNNNFKQGVVRGVATMVITPALGGAMGEFGKTALGTGLTTGLTTFATNSLTAGDGWSIGWDGGNWQQHLTEGVASGVTAAIMQGARGKQGKDAQGRPITGTDKQPQPNVFGDSFVNKAVSGAINSSIMTMGYHAFGGNGFENNSFSKFNWNSMAYSAQDLGGFLGNKANGWVLNHYGINKDTGVRTGSRENDNWLDKAASYLHEGAIKIDNGIKGFFSNVGKMVGDGVRDFAQSTGNLFKYGEFATGDSSVIKNIKARELYSRLERLLGRNGIDTSDIGGEGRGDTRTGLYADAKKFVNSKSELDCAKENPDFYNLVKKLKAQGMLEKEITNPENMGQWDRLDKGVGKKTLELFEQIRKNPNLLKFNSELGNAYDVLTQRKNELMESIEYSSTKVASSITKEINYINSLMNGIDNKKEVFENTKNYILNGNINERAMITQHNLCCVIAFWEHGVLSGKDVRSFNDFVFQEIGSGNIGQNGKNANAYYASWGVWADDRDMQAVTHKGEKIQGTNNYKYNSITKNDINNLNRSGKTEAVAWIDKNNSGIRGSHWVTIKKHASGAWYNYDNNRKKGRVNVINRNSIFGLFY